MDLGTLIAQAVVALAVINGLALSLFLIRGAARHTPRPCGCVRGPEGACAALLCHRRVRMVHLGRWEHV